MGVVIFLLWVAVTIQYRVELGAISFSLLEPFALLAIATLILYQLTVHRQLYVAKDGVLFLLLALMVWILTIQVLTEDLRNSLSDLRDWLIPTLTYTLLVAVVRRGWRRWMMLFLAVAVLNALVGFYQHFTDGFRPFVKELSAFKTGFAVTGEGQLAFVSYSVGFFTHPNAFAMYLFLALMISLGWLSSRGHALGKLVVIGILSASLFFTYAKASLVVMTLAVLFFWMVHRSYSLPRLLTIGGGLLFATILGIWIGVRVLPPLWLTTFWWRVTLWESALSTIAENPSILFFGNGLTPFARRAIYPQPHNLYLYVMLQYGLPGLFLLLLLAWELSRRGVQAYRRGWVKQHPILGALWVGLLGFFAIGLVESNLAGVEMRMIFLIVASGFTGMLHEIRRASAPSAPRASIEAQVRLQETEHVPA